MEEWYSNNTLQNYSHDYDYDYSDYDESFLIETSLLKNEDYIACWMAIVICPPLIILAIYYLFSLLCCMAIWLGKPMGLLEFITFLIHLLGLMASVGFMVCISLQRYLLIAWPLWYSFRRTIKSSLVVCVVIWVLALVISCLVAIMDMEHNGRHKPIGVILLLPFPVLIFSVVGIFKGLSAAISISSEEKRRIVGATILVLLNYTLLFLPYIIGSITPYRTMPSPLAFIFFNPLGDLVLYVFMRKGAIDKILAYVCCCRMETQQQQIIAVNDNSTTVTSV
ncbi:G-protein coupled receptor 4-like isoform X2 [Scomber scombrus]|uniref:G-protein coupled receptor 4-like isoform X2 n=1 Tax=Scomber scombrus TaxID=13677 RepID=UPI002DD94519|nr:G-protein coupled receptor 4-like isoform X2 [Scomber scombrus]